MKRVNNPSWETSDGKAFYNKKEAMLYEAKLELATLIDNLPDVNGVDAANAVLLDSEEWMRVISLMRRRAK